jgi:hypothetical protein
LNDLYLLLNMFSRKVFETFQHFPHPSTHIHSYLPQILLLSPFSRQTVHPIIISAHFLPGLCYEHSFLSFMFDSCLLSAQLVSGCFQELVARFSSTGKCPVLFDHHVEISELIYLLKHWPPKRHWLKHRACGPSLAMVVLPYPSNRLVLLSNCLLNTHASEEPLSSELGYPARLGDGFWFGLMSLLLLYAPHITDFRKHLERFRLVELYWHQQTSCWPPVPKWSCYDRTCIR